MPTGKLPLQAFVLDTFWEEAYVDPSPEVMDLFRAAISTTPKECFSFREWQDIIELSTRSY